MIDPKALLTDLKKVLRDLEGDLRERSEEDAATREHLREEYRRAKEAERTATTYESWREEQLTQVAVAWILGCVFVRFLEDNGLIGAPRLAGVGERLGLARDHHELYFREHPTETDREYLYAIFSEVAELPAATGLFDRKHNPLWAVGLSGDGATKLLDFWRKVDPGTGELVHNFTDPEWNTRFLGDLYQDLSEAAKKKYALLQTPEFVEEFILDRTLTPAIEEFGFREIRLIDPACGSGHFLLGAFWRLFDLWTKSEPGTNARELAARAFGQIYGADLNPFAVAIARFRLLVAGMKAAGIGRLKDAPGFPLNLAVGDSLLHGRRFTPGAGLQGELTISAAKHLYETEDGEALRRILGQQYHAVVGNPPYITPKDKAANEAYRSAYGSCHMKYALAVPFMERLFELAMSGAVDGQPAGYVGMITANSFMKREFGKKLVEEFVPRWDLTHVVDTSGAYIPGHGTPTVILFGRNRAPVEPTVRAVMGIRGEPSTPENPATAEVWTAIVSQIDNPSSQGDFVSVSDVSRQTFHQHPWSLSGGGAAEFREELEDAADSTLADCVESIGVETVTLEDDAFALDRATLIRQRIAESEQVAFVIGENVRDWTLSGVSTALFPYSGAKLGAAVSERGSRVLWPFRTGLCGRLMFGRTQIERGLAWYEYGMMIREKHRVPLSITLAFVATHNHFVLDRGGKVFNRSAPVIKLGPEATEDDHLALLGPLNSSTGCFWMKQVMAGKHKGDGGPAHANPAYQRLEFDGSKLNRLPLPKERPLALARRLEELAQELSTLTPMAICTRETPDATKLAEARERYEKIRHLMISLQEDLDWDCYQLYEILDENLVCPSKDVPPIQLGERAFEIVLARKMEAGKVETTWFERHGSTPITEIPAHWPEDFRKLVQRRIEAIEKIPEVGLIERPEYKRRWDSEPWESQEERALRSWLLDRLEDRRHWPEIALTSTARLADSVRKDEEFMQVAALYRKNPDFDVAALVAELVEEEAVPFLPVYRYKESGLRKRKQWEETWELQRKEDAIDARTKLTEGDPNHLSRDEADALKAREVGDIPVPPKYTSSDFRKSSYWRLRGKLDVPKERFVSYPGCEREADPTTVVAWAGWNHLEQAKALGAYYVQMRDQEGWTVDKLVPLLASIVELLPWLRQWHNEIDPEYGVRMGDFYGDFVREETRKLGFTEEKIREWEPA